MKLFTATLAVAIFACYILIGIIFAERGILRYQEKQQHLHVLRHKKEALMAKNASIENKLHEIQTNPDVLEGYIRRQFTLIGKGEVFYFVDKDKLVE